MSNEQFFSYIMSMLDRGFCQVTPKTIKLVFAVSPLSTQEKEQILVGSESEKELITDYTK
jgi:hypothetical protein